ncbi:NUDIX hydrolase [Nocardioides aurantiacus]|uniref:ADP-ribose pyrophosphatase YjhB (NUDIX family) n=1 Tax=Nocardioides aurantiacus TaxID=86796 RepID=A0A3N2CY32_9ACTN|nr:NUDIX domain-containing protein [Nocardioides aurantiacus]ROR92363.1 ADP-ribose pyrophosphatase YjhB (NUDIX family) [Nocardioides aurantiacus]
MTLHDTARAALAGWTAPGADQERLRTSYVAHLDARPDGVRRACFPAHLTAGALVLSDDGDHVLLNLHRKARRWFHFGGHLEDGDATLQEGARREATEESGLPDLAVDAEPLHLSRHRVEFCDPRGPVDHLDVRFLARAAAGVEPVVSDESLDVRWWPVDALPTQDADMVEMIGLARDRARSADRAGPAC